MVALNAFLFIILLQGLLFVDGHSWLDCVKVTNPREATSLANLDCSGYPADYVGRANADANMYKIEGTMTNEQFLAKPTCKTTTRSYSAQHPRTVLRAGEYFTLGYTPNGHAAWMPLPNGPPPRGAQDFWVKWVPNKPGTQMISISDMLNATTLFRIQFDTPCHDRVTNAPLDPSAGLCAVDIQIPPNTPQGVYQFVWYWPFRFQSATLVEDYISCFDIEVLPPGATTGGNNPTPNPTPRPTTKPTGSTTGMSSSSTLVSTASTSTAATVAATTSATTSIAAASTAVSSTASASTATISSTTSTISSTISTISSTTSTEPGSTSTSTSFKPYNPSDLGTAGRVSSCLILSILFALVGLFL